MLQRDSGWFLIVFQEFLEVAPASSLNFLSLDAQRSVIGKHRMAANKDDELRV